MNSTFWGTKRNSEKDFSPNIFNFKLGFTNNFECDEDLRWLDVGYKYNIYLLNKKGLYHKYTWDIQLLTYKKFFYQLEASAESLIKAVNKVLHVRSRLPIPFLGTTMAIKQQAKKYDSISIDAFVNYKPLFFFSPKKYAGPPQYT